MLGICSCQFIPGQFAFIVQRNMSWEHYNLALIKSWVPEYNQLQTAGQSKQVLSVMRLHLGRDGSIVMGEQYLKALERGTKVSTWADLTGSLWQHLATHTQTHKHPSGNKGHGEKFLQGHLTPHKNRGCQLGPLQTSAETSARSPA